MAEVLGFAASVIAVVQLSDSVIKICKSYIESVKDYPSDLRRVLLEISTLKELFQNLKFLDDNDPNASVMLSNLARENGPIQACRAAVTVLERKFSETTSVSKTPEQQGSNGRQRRRMTPSLQRLAWPLRAHRVQTLLGEISQYKSDINLVFSTEMLQDVKHIKQTLVHVTNELDESAKYRFFEWLQITNPSSNHNIAEELYEPETGAWLVRSPEWNDWLERRNRCIWVHGIPGAGKTVLFSHLVNNIESNCQSRVNEHVVYYYCYHQRNQDEAAPFLRWVLGQLCHEAQAAPHELLALHRKNMMPTLAQLLAALEQVISQFNTVYIAIDALDESENRASLLRVLRDFVQDHRFSKIQLLTTSREYMDIEDSMIPISTPISMDNPSVQDDIHHLMSKTLEKERSFKNWSQGLKDQVSSALAKGAKGMFRWAVCQLDILRRMRTSEARWIMQSLRSLPKTLDETYERIFQSLDEYQQTIVQSVMWHLQYHAITGQKTPFPLSFLIGLLPETPINSSNAIFDPEQDCAWLREICGCLIRVSTFSSLVVGGKPYQVVSVAHYTVREFLTSPLILESSASQFSCHKQTVLQNCLQEILHGMPKRLATYQVRSVELPTELKEHYISVLAMVFDCPARPSHQWSRNEAIEEDKDDTLRQITIDFLGSALPPTATNFPIIANELYFLDLFTSIGCDPCSLDPGTFLLVRLMFTNLTWLLQFVIEDLLAQDILQQHFVPFQLLRYQRASASDCIYQIHSESNVIGLLARCIMREKYRFALPMFTIFLEHCVELFDPSLMLVFCSVIHIDCKSWTRTSEYIYARRHWDHEYQCPLEFLLRAGADPGFAELPLTPLQLAVLNGDSSAVNLLLEHDADPNGIGAVGNRSWENSNITCFKKADFFRGQSPLYCLRHGPCFSRSHDSNSVEDENYERKRHEIKIELLLIEAGGKEFVETLNSP